MSQDNAMTSFNYDPPTADKPKKIVWLARTDRLFAAIQVIASGGETNLHSHSHLDGLWFVLRGKARFYSDETTIHCELGPQQGVLVPRGTKYWFERIGDEPLEILQVECSDVAMNTNKDLIGDRVDYTPRAPRAAPTEQIQASKV